jgi:hypothetical protein
MPPRLGALHALAARLFRAGGRAIMNWSQCGHIPGIQAVRLKGHDMWLCVACKEKHPCPWMYVSFAVLIAFEPLSWSMLWRSSVIPARSPAVSKDNHPGDQWPPLNSRCGMMLSCARCRSQERTAGEHAPYALSSNLIRVLCVSDSNRKRRQ